MNRKITECLHLLGDAQSLGHDRDECDALRWQCWMLLGDFENAWKVSDGFAARGTPDPNRLWDGKPFAGRRVMIRCLHGFGDAIQFIRYARLVKLSAQRVTVQTHPELVSLFSRQSYIDCAITWGDPSTEWNQQVEVMELPRAFRTTAQTIPCNVPYLSGRERSWPSTSKKRVGILWEGGGWDRDRDVPLVDLSPILQMHNEVELINFQRGPGREALLSARGEQIRDLSGDSPDVSEFADDLLSMDLLITVDTMAAHLAGALGRPVWVMLPYCANWRWMLRRCDSPWYPTMRLFRQETLGDWRAPVNQIAARLREFAAPQSLPYRLI